MSMRAVLVALLSTAACSAPRGSRVTSAPPPEPSAEGSRPLPDNPSAGTPFDGGADNLAVEEDEAGQSLRPKLRLRRLGADEVMVRVIQVDDGDYPTCKVTARVIKAARRHVEHNRLLGRGRAYRFTGSGGVDSPGARARLGLCYYPSGTRLALQVSGVDRELGVFRVSTARPI